MTKYHNRYTWLIEIRIILVLKNLGVHLLFNLGMSSQETFVVEVPIKTITQDLEAYFSKDKIGFQRIVVVTDIEHTAVGSRFHAGVVTDYDYTILVTVDLKYVTDQQTNVDLYLGSNTTGFAWFFTFLFLLMWLFIQWLPLFLFALFFLVISFVVLFRRTRIKNKLFHTVRSILRKRSTPDK